MKRLMWIRLLLAALLVLNPAVPVFAQSGGNCAVFRTWNTGDSVTAGDLNSSFNQAAVLNSTLDCVDGYSDSAGNMNSSVNPWAATDTTSAATNARGEIERLRYILENTFGWANWYRRDTSIDFATGVNLDGVGLGRHITGVALHTWSGSNVWPAITSVQSHTTGLMWGMPGGYGVSPTGSGRANHLAIMVDATADSGRFCCASGQTNARTWYAFHASAMTFHHTAALRFAHSNSMMGNGQYGHVTALQVSTIVNDTVNTPLNNAGWSDGNDRLIVGHAGTVLQMVGYGASHVALGAGSSLVLGRHVGTLPAVTPVANALYADSIVKAWVNFDGMTGAPVGQSFNVASVARNSLGNYSITWQRAFLDLHYAVGGSAFCTGATCIFSFDPNEIRTTTVIRLNIVDVTGAPRECLFCQVIVVGRQ